MKVTLFNTITVSELKDLLGDQVVEGSSDFDDKLSFINVTNSTLSSDSGTLLILESGAEKYFNSKVEALAVITIGQLGLKTDLPVLILKDSKFAYQELLKILFPEALSLEQNLVAITGTNGKTSTNWLLYHALELSGFNAQRIGTLGLASSQLVEQRLNNTTPDLFFNYAAIAEANQKAVNNTVIEVSSHGLSLQRVLGLNFSVAIYTNLSRDHFDFYKNFENYYQAKKLLFTQLADSSAKKRQAIINADDQYGERLIKELSGVADYPIYTYGSSENATIQILPSQQSLSSATYAFKISDYQINFNSKLLGKFNEYNLAACLACLHFYYGIALESLGSLMTKLPAVPGRLEPYQVGDIAVLVDYAHTPDALENAINSLKCLDYHQLWVVFGCGGDRDPGKRKEMAEVCQRLADKIVVTSDNPRTEDPQAIIDDILIGCQATIVEADRTKAIKLAVQAASPRDIILIAGKGHEDYQEVNGKFLDYSDVDVIRDLLLS